MIQTIALTPYVPSTPATTASAVAAAVAALPAPATPVSSIAIPANVTDDQLGLTTPVILSLSGETTELGGVLDAESNGDTSLVGDALRAQYSRVQ